MPGDLPHAHASRVHRDDLVVEAREPPLVLGDQRRVEAAGAVAGYLQLDLAGSGRHRLAAVAVAAVAGLTVDQVMVHFGVQSPLGQRLLQLVEQTVGIKNGPGVGATEQLVKQRVGDHGWFASWHAGSPFFPLCPPAHGIPDSPSAAPTWSGTTPTTTPSSAF